MIHTHLRSAADGGRLQMKADYPNESAVPAKDQLLFVEKGWSKNTVPVKATCQNTKCLSRGRTQLQTLTEWNSSLQRRHAESKASSVPD